MVGNIDIINLKTKSYNRQVNKINDELVKLILSLGLKSGSMLEVQSEKYRENIFWYMSVLQDITKYQNVIPKLEQEIRDYKSFVKTQKQKFKNFNPENTR